MVTLIDPLEALREDRKASTSLSSAEVILPPAPPVAGGAGMSVLEHCKADFRVFVTYAWRFLLKCDPAPIQLDMAYWMQHSPDRTITMAFRGFSKSWITGLYAIWCLLRNPDEKVLVVSGSLNRAVATTNWCLSLILTMPILKDLIPQPSMRQSGAMFDVGNCVPQQSASFMALGILGQMAGFRASLIIPDDVETQTNSNTVTMRETIRDAVKEFESVLTPGGSIKYLGTPHDADSLYLFLLRLRGEDGLPVYSARVWPALFPSAEEAKVYGPHLAPYITSYINKHGPGVIGHSTMPTRFPDSDLARRKAASGNSEFRLQFLLDLSGAFTDKYPLKLANLIVMDLDDKHGPEQVVWGTTKVERDLPVVGFDGDFYYGPINVSGGVAPYSRIVGYIDSSGTGTDEAAIAVIGELYGRLYLLFVWGSVGGLAESTLGTFASLCVRYGINKLLVEDNFGGGAYSALLRPRVIEAWRVVNEAARKAHGRDAKQGGTEVVSVKTSKVSKEKRILGVLSPITEGHRLVVNRQVILDDTESVNRMDGEETRHSYSLFYQFTHLTAEADCLRHDDRLDAVAGACGEFVEQLGVNPQGLAEQAAQERIEDELEALFDDADAVTLRGGPAEKKPADRAAATLPRKR